MHCISQKVNCKSKLYGIFWDKTIRNCILNIAIGRFCTSLYGGFCKRGYTLFLCYLFFLSFFLVVQGAHSLSTLGPLNQTCSSVPRHEKSTTLKINKKKLFCVSSIIQLEGYRVICWMFCALTNIV